MKKILLTGGNGFIGKNIQGDLRDKYEIVAPRSFELNLADEKCVDDFFQDKFFDVVIHAATKPGHRNSNDTANLFETNIGMFENLAKHKDKYGKFINLGSGAIYDTSKNISNAKEEQRFNSMGEKDHDKCKFIISKKIEELDNFIDLNIFGVFGKHEDWEIRFISNAICKTLFDLPITLRQNRRFSYLFVEDLMPILEFFIESDYSPLEGGKYHHKSYNIVPDKNTELLEIAQIVKKISGKNIEIKVAQEGYGFDYTGDNARLKKEFNVKFTDLNTSIKKLYKYYQENIDLIDKSLLLADK